MAPMPDSVDLKLIRKALMDFMLIMRFSAMRSTNFSLRFPS